MNQGFADKLMRWQKKYGRHRLPWQSTRDPYAIWVAEVMLQQTQVMTVIPYYCRFMQCFPDLRSLARAPIEKVLTLWSGLGYYARGRNLHQAACQIMDKHHGEFPRKALDILHLPGIGRSTAAAIAAFAFGESCAILDGNVKRILTRYFGIAGYPGERAIEARLWQLAESLLPEPHDQKIMASYTQAMMDLGALICVRSRPHCQRCPLQVDCVAYKQNETASLPTAKPKKSLPRKQIAHLIVIDDQKRIMLIKRPARGIWGGLWCFPEMPLGRDCLNYCQQNYHIRVKKLSEIPRFHHTFTHFKLCIHPQLMRLVTPELISKETDHIWVTFDDAMKLALPAPIKRLLPMTEVISRSTSYV